MTWVDECIEDVQRRQFEVKPLYVKKYRKQVGKDSYEAKVFEEAGVSRGFWQRFVKPSVRLIKNDTCESCGLTTAELDIHHESYEQITIATMKLLCESCHYKLESQKRSGIKHYTNKGEQNG